MNITLETAADKLVKEIFGVKSGETVIITADDDSDASVVEAVKNSAKNAGAHAMVISVPTPGGVGKSSRPGSSGRRVKRSTSLCRCMDRV